MPPFESVKFGLALAALVLAIIGSLLACYWKVSHYLVERNVRRKWGHSRPRRT